MSYSFASLVSSIKDKSSLAIATLSSDLKEFTSIVQEDVEEVAKTLRKTVHEQSEAMRIRAEQAEAESEAIENEETETDSTFSFRHLTLESMGSKLLHTADGLLGTLAGSEIESESSIASDRLIQAQQYRLIALQEDIETYTEPPMDLETFLKWQQTLNPTTFEQQQQQVVTQYSLVQEQYQTLVSNTKTISHQEFWMHYLYKESLLVAQEKRGTEGLFDLQIEEEEEEIGWEVESPCEKDEQDAFPSTEAAEEAEEVDTRSEGGESWTNVVQPPLSSSSSTSSFVPIEGISVPIRKQEVIEDDGEWEEEEEEEQLEKELKKTIETRVQTSDWGEWD